MIVDPGTTMDPSCWSGSNCVVGNRKLLGLFVVTPIVPFDDGVDSEVPKPPDGVCPVLAGDDHDALISPPFSPSTPRRDVLSLKTCLTAGLLKLYFEPKSNSHIKAPCLAQREHLSGKVCTASHFNLDWRQAVQALAALLRNVMGTDCLSWKTNNSLKIVQWQSAYKTGHREVNYYPAEANSGVRLPT